MPQYQFVLSIEGILSSFLAATLLRIHPSKRTRTAITLSNLSFLNGLIIIMILLIQHYDGVQESSAFLFKLFCFCSSFLQSVQALLITYFTQALLENRHLKMNPSLRFLSLGSACILMLETFLNLFSGFIYTVDANNYFHYGNYYMLPIALTGVTFSLNAYQVIHHYKHFLLYERVSFFSIFILPLGAILISFRFPNYSLMTFSITLSVFILLICFLLYHYEFGKEQERQLLITRSHLLNSQIQPHFIFNTLNTIQALIEIDPNEASDTVQHFSSYLRQTLGTLRDDGLISFQSEMEHVKHYIYIEKKRFGDKLKVIYDYDPQINFLIPYLSIEPMVENAVRHGLRGKLEGGTVVIRAYKAGEDYYVQVEDDGVGFENSQLVLSDRVGLNNLKQRVELLCNGSMSIKSQKGHGASVTLRLPQVSKRSTGSFD